MEYPFFKCNKCKTEIAEVNLPIPSNQVYPKCPKCGDNSNVDVAIGDENDRVTDSVLLQMLQDVKEGVI